MPDVVYRVLKAFCRAILCIWVLVTVRDISFDAADAVLISEPRRKLNDIKSSYGWQFNNARWQVGKLATSTSFTLFLRCSMISQSRWLVSIKSVSSYLQQLETPTKTTDDYQLPKFHGITKAKTLVNTSSVPPAAQCYRRGNMFGNFDNFKPNKSSFWPFLLEK